MLGAAQHLFWGAQQVLTTDQNNHVCCACMCLFAGGGFLCVRQAYIHKYIYIFARRRGEKQKKTLEEESWPTLLTGLRACIHAHVANFCFRRPLYAGYELPVVLWESSGGPTPARRALRAKHLCRLCAVGLRAIKTLHIRTDSQSPNY